MDRRRNRQRGAGPPGRRQRMQLGRRMVHRQGLGGRRQCRTRPCCGSERMDLGRRRRFLCPGLLRRRGPCVRRYRGEGRLRLWRCAGGRACGRGRRLRGLLATSVVREIIAGFARTESGRTAVDRRRADARGGSELSGRRRLIAASGCWLAGAAKARQQVFALPCSFGWSRSLPISGAGVAASGAGVCALLALCGIAIAAASSRPAAPSTP